MPTELQTQYSELKKKERFTDVEVFASDFTDEITEGFKSGAPYSDMTDSPSELTTKSPRDSNRDLRTVTTLMDSISFCK
jgi:hypothetical protein